MKSKKPMQHTLLAIKRQAGMTLMEIIAALAIIAAVVVGALSLFNSAQSSNNAVTMLKDIIAVRSAVQQLYTGQGGYSNTANAINVQLHNAKKEPSDLIWQASESRFRTSWNGRLYVNVTTPNAPNFQIVLTQVPAEVCAQLVASAANGWLTVNVAGTTYNRFPVTPTQASASCNTAAAGSTITWTTVN
jgi:prepilin-type N-terminal cleavage/methylation domain-containing protein